MSIPGDIKGKLVSSLEASHFVDILRTSLVHVKLVDCLKGGKEFDLLDVHALVYK